MGNDRKLAAHLGHDILQHSLSLANTLINTFSGGAAHVKTLYILFKQMAGQRPDPLGRDISRIVVAGVERGNNPLEFFNF